MEREIINNCKEVMLWFPYEKEINFNRFFIKCLKIVDLLVIFEYNLGSKKRWWMQNPYTNKFF